MNHPPCTDEKQSKEDNNGSGPKKIFRHALFECDSSFTSSFSPSKTDDGRNKASLSNHNNTDIDKRSDIGATNYNNGHSKEGNNATWYPHDPLEKVLNPIEIELAWLGEESVLYSLNNTNNKNSSPSSEFSWDFIARHASPQLKTRMKHLNKNHFKSNDTTSQDEYEQRWLKTL
eukprot:11207949-Ditylum_brightwellii.AAC.1